MWVNYSLIVLALIYLILEKYSSIKKKKKKHLKYIFVGIAFLTAFISIIKEYRENYEAKKQKIVMQQNTDTLNRVKTNIDTLTNTVQFINNQIDNANLKIKKNIELTTISLTNYDSIFKTQNLIWKNNQNLKADLFQLNKLYAQNILLLKEIKSSQLTFDSSIYHSRYFIHPINVKFSFIKKFQLDLASFEVFEEEKKFKNDILNYIDIKKLSTEKEKAKYHGLEYYYFPIEQALIDKYPEKFNDFIRDILEVEFKFRKSSKDDFDLILKMPTESINKGQWLLAFNTNDYSNNPYLVISFDTNPQIVLDNFNIKTVFDLHNALFEMNIMQFSTAYEFNIFPLISITVGNNYKKSFYIPFEESNTKITSNSNKNKYSSWCEQILVVDVDSININNTSNLNKRVYWYEFHNSKILLRQRH